MEFEDPNESPDYQWVDLDDVASALLAAQESGHYFAPAPRASARALERTSKAVQKSWLLRGLEQDYVEVDRQLRVAHIGQSRWRNLQQDLLTLNDPKAELFILDYCPEIRPEEVARVKREVYLFDVADFEPNETTRQLEEMLLFEHPDLVGRFSLTCVEYQLTSLAEKISTLTELRETLRQAVFSREAGPPEA